MLRAHGTPIFGGRGGRTGSAMASLERTMVVSYRLSIVTVALSVTILPQFAIECLRRSNRVPDSPSEDNTITEAELSGWWPGLVVARWSRSTKLPYAGPG